MRTHVRCGAALALASLAAAVFTVVPLAASPAMALGPDDSWGDVYALNRDDNGRVAVHVTDGASNYGGFTLSIRTPLNSSPVWQFGMGDFEGDGVTDLYAINPNDAGRTAVHVLSGASNFQTFVAQFVTPMHETSGSVWEHRVGDYNADGRADIFVINRDDGGRTAVHVLDAASGFQAFSAHEVTALHATTDSQWELFAADFNGDRRADLYAVNRNDGGKTAVHVLDGSSKFQTFVAHQVSALPATTDWVWSLAVGDREGDGAADVYAFNRSDVATSNTRTSVHVANAAALFDNLSLQVVSAIGMTADPLWELHVSTLARPASSETQLEQAVRAVSSGTYTEAQYQLVMNDPYWKQHILDPKQSWLPTVTEYDEVPSDVDARKVPSVCDGSTIRKTATASKAVKNGANDNLYIMKHKVSFCYSWGLAGEKRVIKAVYNRQTWFDDVQGLVIQLPPSDEYTYNPPVSGIGSTQATSIVEKKVQHCIFKYGCVKTGYPRFTLKVRSDGTASATFSGA